MRTIAFISMTLFLSSCMAATPTNPNKEDNQDKTYTLNRITGDTALDGLMVSKGFSKPLQGLSEDRKSTSACVVAAGQYYPSAKNDFGQDGNFMTVVHLEPQIANKDYKKADIKKGETYYFLALTGEGWFQILHKGKVYNLLESPNFPEFKQPKVDKWFKVPCANNQKKIWLKLDNNLLKQSGICKLTAAAPDYGSGIDEPDIEGDCQ